MIYAYEDQTYPGLLKVGYTTIEVARRVAQQYPTLRPGQLPYRIVFQANAMRNDGSTFTDHAVHRLLRKRFANPKGEWFRCTVDDVKAAVLAVKERQAIDTQRTETFGMRPEQAAAVERTATYFERQAQENSNRTPHFLWNCKMRFGKTFATYQLARRMGWKRLLVLTFKPAVENAWEEDLRTHRDFEGWQFISHNNG